MYNDAITANTRTFLGHVDFNNVNSTYKATDNPTTDLDIASFSIVGQLTDNDRHDLHYATFEEDYLDIDVGFYIPVLNTPALHCPFTSSLLEFTDEYITVTHDGSDVINGITILFDEYGVIDSLDYEITHEYDGSPTSTSGTITREDIVNNRYFISGNFYNTAGLLEISFNNLVNTTAKNRLRIVEIDFGMSFTFGAGTLLDFNANNRVSITSEEMPINPLTMNIYDNSGTFEMTSTNTQLDVILKSNMRIYPYVGIMEANGYPLFAQQGIFYLKSIDQTNANIYTFSAEDGMTILNSYISPYKHNIFTTSPITLDTSHAYVDNMFISTLPFTDIPFESWTYDEGEAKYYLIGQSNQNGTPSPDDSVPITHTYETGTYKTTVLGKTYIFTLSTPLRSVNDGDALLNYDRIWLDTDTDVFTRDTQIMETTIDGTPTWTLSGSSTGTYLRAYYTDTNVKGDGYMISDLFPYGKYTVTDGEVLGSIAGTVFNISILKTRATDVAALKTWLGSNNITVEHEMATPVLGTAVFSGVWTGDQQAIPLSFTVYNNLPASTYVDDAPSSKWNYILPIQQICLINGYNAYFDKSGNLQIKTDDISNTRTIYSTDLIGSPTISKGNELKKIIFNLNNNANFTVSNYGTIYTETITETGNEIYRYIALDKQYAYYSTVVTGTGASVNIIYSSCEFIYLKVNNPSEATVTLEIKAWQVSSSNEVKEVSNTTENNGDNLEVKSDLYTSWASTFTTPSTVAQRIFNKTDKFKIEFDYRGDFYLEPLDLINVETKDGYKSVTVYEANITYDGGFKGHIVGGFSTDTGGSI